MSTSRSDTSALGHRAHLGIGVGRGRRAATRRDPRRRGTRPAVSGSRYQVTAGPAHLSLASRSAQIQSCWVVALPVEHRRLVLERLDERAVGHLEDHPRPRGGQLGEVGVGPGGRGGLGGGGEVVAHAHQLQVADARVDVEGAVGQVALGGARRGAQLDLGEEVERRRGRRLEEQALHRADAAVGPVRQEHQRHRRAVAVDLLLVLPERPAAAVLLADLAHGVHEVAVLARRPPCPRSRCSSTAPTSGRSSRWLTPLSSSEPRVAAVGPLRRRRAASAAAARRTRTRASVTTPAATAGPTMLGRSGSRRDQDRDGADDLGHADGRQEVEAQVVEGQQAGVPEPALAQADERHRHEQGAAGEVEADADPERDRQDHARRTRGRGPSACRSASRRRCAG